MIPLLSAALLVPACDMEIGNLNGLDLETLEQNPTPALVNEAAVGLLIGNRAGKAAANGFVSVVGVLGRESYNFDSAEPRYRSELLEAAALNEGSPAFGGNYWTAPYSNIRNVHVLLKAIDRLPDDALSAEYKEGIRGFAKTIKALDFLTIANTRWLSGGPIDVDRPINAPLAPIEDRNALYQHISDLLDEAESHLEAAGGSFSFPLSSGYAGFNTPATFLQFNRAVAARVYAYRENWEAVLAALDRSFLTVNGNALNVGVYHAYSAGSGDVANGLTNRNLYVHPSVEAAAEYKESGGIDDRVTRKTAETDPVSVTSGMNMYTSDRRFVIYTGPSSPLPLIRNEELLLLAAEAHIGLGQYDQALPYINLVRTASGGLPALDALDPATAVDELLQQRFYSLLFEGGHRWIDMRRYDRLEELKQYDEVEGLYVHQEFPIPIAEQNARKSDD